MKKLILMTSALTLIGGAAIAQDISVGGTASLTYGNWGTGDGGTAGFDFGTEVVLGLEGSSGDFTYGAELTLENDARVSQGVIWIATGFSKFSFGEDAFDELSADVDVDVEVDINGVFADINGVEVEGKDYGDFKYEGTFGDIDVTLVADTENGATPGDGAIPGDSADWWAMLGYSGDGFSLGLETDSTDSYEVSFSFDTGDFTIGGSVDDSDFWEAYVSTTMGIADVTLTTDRAELHSIAVSGAMGDVSWSAEADTGEARAASINWSMGAVSVGLAWDNDDAGCMRGGGACLGTPGIPLRPAILAMDAIPAMDEIMVQLLDGESFSEPAVPAVPAVLAADAVPAVPAVPGKTVDGEDYGDEADLIVSLVYSMDNLSFAVMANGQSEYEISMTAQFEF